MEAERFCGSLCISLGTEERETSSKCPSNEYFAQTSPTVQCRWCALARTSFAACNKFLGTGFRPKHLAILHVPEEPRLLVEPRCLTV